MTAELLAAPALAPARSGPWRRPLMVLAIVTAGLLLLFARDAAAMASIWWSSSSYEHCLVILPIIAWLVWQRADMLAALQPRPWALPLAWVAAGSLAWLVGEAGGVAAMRHLGLVMMIQGAVATLTGRAATTVLAFPLFYLLFLVPVGDALVPPLQTLTARMCMVLLAWARVPAHLDGVFLTTPAGWFKVAEACSGAKFLIAMTALGALVAHLGFRSWPRRIAFLALCLIVPVLANGVRAFGTIWVAQWRGAKAASGIDHVIYGWIFFAVVIAAVLAVSWRFFDRSADAPPADPDRVAREGVRQARTLPLLPAALAVGAIAAAAPAWSALVAGRGVAPLPASIGMPALPGWNRVAGGPGTPWRPRYDGADRLALGHFRSGDGAIVDVALAVYASQDEGRSLVGYGHGAVDPASHWAWAADLPAPPELRMERVEAPGPDVRIVATAYRLGGITTGSAAEVKLATLRLRLLGGRQQAAALLVSADRAGGGRAAVDRYLAGLGPLGPAIDRAVGGR